MLTRILEQWGTTLALLYLLTGGCGQAPSRPQWRLALFVGAVVVLYLERRRLERVFAALDERLRQVGRIPGPRLARRRLSQGVLVLLWAAWAVALGLGSPSLRRALEGAEALPGLVVIWTVSAGWTLATALWLGVAMDRLSLARRGLVGWWAAREARRAARAEAAAGAQAPPHGEAAPPPPPPPAAPPAPTPAVWPAFTAACAGLALVLACLGIPRAETTLRAASLGLDLLELARATPALPPARASLELLVELGPDDEIGEVLPALRQHGAWPRAAFPGAADADLAATWAVRVPAAQLDALARALDADHENVDHIELNATLSAPPAASGGGCRASQGALPVNDPLAQRAWQQAGVARALGLKPPRRVRVALVDTGVDGEHEDLRGVLSRFSPRGDARGHGTQVAGLLAGLTHNRRGVASLNRGGALVELVNLPALARADADVEDVVDALLEAIEGEAAVINLSFNQRGDAPRAVARALELAHARGVIVVASAGNDPLTPARAAWPANVPGVIVVGSAGGGSSPLSGLSRAVLAPGADICTTQAGGGYVEATGTSFAAPMVSAGLAFARALCPQLDADLAWSLLRQADRSRAAPPHLDVDGLLDVIATRGCP